MVFRVKQYPRDARGIAVASGVDRPADWLLQEKALLASVLAG
jgi:hypothetical protein